MSIGEMIMIVKMICAGGRNQRNRLKIRVRDTKESARQRFPS